jgi:hypothetical protein
MSGRTSKRYPAQLRERAIRTDGEIRADHESEWAAMTQVATLLGVGTSETVVGLQDHPRDLLRAARSPANRRGGQGRAAAADDRSGARRSRVPVKVCGLAAVLGEREQKVVTVTLDPDDC